MPDPEDLRAGAENLNRELQALEAQGFAGQAVIVHGDEVLLLSGYGDMGVDDPRPVTDNAVMPLASLTKPFTASAVLALAAEGKLTLEDPLGKHLTELRSPWADLPIESLLTHTAGLPAEIASRRYEGDHRFEPVDRDTFLERVQHFEPDHPPGRAFNYSNVGYGLLAAVVEVVSKQHWEAFLAGSVLATAGVSEIGFLRPDWGEADMVRARDGDRDQGNYFTRPYLEDGMGWHLRGSGDLLARPQGIVAWWQAIRRGLWLSRPWLERWLTPRVDEADGTQYGYGLHFRSSPWGQVIGHTGGQLSYTVDFSWFIESDLMVYINSASQRFEADLMRERLHRLLVPGHAAN